MTREAKPDVERIALPTWRHLPGQNDRPAEGAFDFLLELSPGITAHADAETNAGWRYGLRLLNHGFFWEAHEVLENVWHRAPPNSRERYLVQTVIHLANGALKLAMGREAAAARLAELARHTLGRAFGQKCDCLMGLRAETLNNAIDRLDAGQDLRPLEEHYEI